VTTERAILWTRYDGAFPLKVVVWEMVSGTYARRVYRSTVTPADGGYVHVDAGGLEPARYYRYAFFEMAGDERIGRSLVGQFRAALGEDHLVRLMFGAFS
jgi:phosphodiesterase/alkaline phosphatase D-like protein